jgi:hypothetical protein
VGEAAPRAGPLAAVLHLALASHLLLLLLQLLRRLMVVAHRHWQRCWECWGVAQPP